MQRWRDFAWWRSYWFDVRPRLLWLEVRGRGIHLRWGMPAWALEETLRGLALTLPWLWWALQRLPGGTRRFQLQGGRFHLRWSGEGPPGPAPWGLTWAILTGVGEGMLRLPPGEPFLDLEVGAGTAAVPTVRVRLLCL